MNPQTLLVVVFLSTVLVVEGAVVPPPDNKIYNGTMTDISKAPWMVSIQLSGNQHCGGAILSKDWILTAAHCTSGFEKSELKLRVGSTRYNVGGEEYLAQQVVIHPNYDTKQFHNDISAIKTSRSINFVGPVSKVNLPTSSPSPSTVLSVYGWGLKEDLTISQTLKTAKVVVIDFQECQKPFYNVSPDESSQICADGVNGLSCAGDSGSAVMKGDVLEGLVSLGIETNQTENKLINRCSGMAPSLYTKVSSFLDWIHKVTGV